MTHVCRSRYKAPWYPAITPAHSRMWRAVQFNLKPSLADNARATTHPIRYTDNAAVSDAVNLQAVGVIAVADELSSNHAVGSNTGRFAFHTSSARVWRHRSIVLAVVFGDHQFANGTEIVTSPLSLIVRSEPADLAYTTITVYEMCAADPDLIAASLDSD